jgi:RNA polymerase sigma-70 factor (ECF subfamily)
MTSSEDFDEFYVRCRDRLITQIFVFTGDEPESRDLVQQAFERAWKHWGRVSGLDDPEAWVRLVAFNLAKDHQRWRRHVSVQASIPQTAPDAIEQEEGLIEFGRALSCLTLDQRRALVLYHLVGLTVREIAIEMSSQPGTVMSWLYRGRANLAAALESLAAIDGEVAGDTRRV